MEYGAICSEIQSLGLFFYLAFGKAIFKVRNQSINKLPQNGYSCRCVFSLFKNQTKLILSAYLILRVNIRLWIKLIYSIFDCFAFIRDFHSIFHQAKQPYFFIAIISYFTQFYPLFPSLKNNSSLFPDPMRPKDFLGIT